MVGAHTPSDGSETHGPALALIAVAASNLLRLNVIEAGPSVRIDAARAVFNHRLPKSVARRLHGLTRRWFAWTIPLFWISQASYLAAPFVTTSSIPPLCITVTTIALALPALILATGSLSVDMVHVVAAETEYRVVTLLNTFQWIMIAFVFKHDVRAYGAIVQWWVVQLAFLVDADVRLHEKRLRTIGAAIVMSGAYLGYTIADVLGGCCDPIFTYNDQPITVDDVLLWTLPTLLLLLLRNLYHQQRRRWGVTIAATSLDNEVPPTVVYCSVYRIRLTLEAATGFGSRRRLHGPTRPSTPLGIAVVRSNTTMSFIDTKETIIKILNGLPHEGLRGLPFALLYSLGVISFIATCCGSVISQIQMIQKVSPEDASSVPSGALLGTTLFFLALVRYLHRSVLVALCQSFDVVFSSLQFICGTVCLGVMYNWDTRSIVLMAWVLWFHALLFFLDALTPPVRKYLRFKKLTITPFVLFTLYALGGPLALIYGYKHTHLYDRVVFKSVRVSTLLVARVFTLWLWNFRLLYDVGVHDDKELLFLRDLATYSIPADALRSHLGSQGKAAVNAVTPNAAILPSATSTTSW